jgi:hypothetical protein
MFAKLHEHFDNAQIVELTHLIALENLRGRFNLALGIGAAGRPSRCHESHMASASLTASSNLPCSTSGTYSQPERYVAPSGHDRVTLPTPGRGEGRGQLPGDRGAVGGRANGVHDLAASARIMPGQTIKQHGTFLDKPVAFAELASLSRGCDHRVQRAADQHRVTGAPRGGQGLSSELGIGRLLFPACVPRSGRRKHGSHREVARWRGPRRRLEQLTETVVRFLVGERCREPVSDSYSMSQCGGPGGIVTGRQCPVGRLQQQAERGVAAARG